MHPPFNPAAHCGILGFFHSCCYEVKHQQLLAGYDHPAYELMRHLEKPGECEPYHLDPYVWERHLKKLGSMIRQRDNEAIKAWFVEHFPKFMALVPKRRRNQFLVGVYRAVNNGIAGPIVRAQQER